METFMKKNALLLLFCVLADCLWAQLPNGDYAPDFTLYEIDKSDGQILTGQAYTLTEYTNAGKAVYLDFFTTNCNPCWSYHQQGAFEDLYNAYGPDGTGEVMAFGIEAGAGNWASLSGAGPDNNGLHTYGNWLEGVPYPVIPLAMSPNTTAVSDDYAIAFYPTICMVCPNRDIYTLGQVSADELYAAKSLHCKEPVLADNARIVKLSGIGQLYYCDATLTPSVKVQNIGTADMTSLRLTVNSDGQTSTYDWTGNVPEYQDVDIVLPPVDVTADGNHYYEVIVSTVNGTDNDHADTYSKSAEYRLLNQPVTAVDETFTTDAYRESWYCRNGRLQWDNQQQAVHFDCMDIMKGHDDELCLPLIDLNGYGFPALQFDVAHARYNASLADTLEVYASSDCGGHWTRVFHMADPELATTSQYFTYPFVPGQSSQWRTEQAGLTAFKSGGTAVKFVFTSGYGNTIWIDNVKIVEGPGSGIKEQAGELGVFPSPAASVLNIRCGAPVERAEIYSLQGQIVGMESGNVQAIGVGGLSPGVYILRVSAGGRVMNRLFVKE